MNKWLRKILNFTAWNRKKEIINHNRINVSPSVHTINIKGENKDLLNDEKIAKLRGNQFHFLIRRIGNVQFKDDFGMDEDSLFKILGPSKYQYEFLYNGENLIDGIRLENGDEIRYSSEMVGVQIYFDSSVNFEKAIKYSKDITKDLVNKTEKEAELLFVINESFIIIPS